MRKSNKFAFRLGTTFILSSSTTLLFTSCFERSNWEPYSSMLQLSNVDNITKTANSAIGATTLVVKIKGEEWNSSSDKDVKFSLEAQGTTTKPEWLGINENTGELTGECAVTATPLSFKIKVTYTVEVAGKTKKIEKSTNAFTITVGAQNSTPPLSTGTLSFNGTSENLDGYLQTLVDWTPLPLGKSVDTGTASDMQVTYSLSPLDSLPLGLYFNPEDGSISGIPSESCPQTSFTITASVANTDSYSAESVSFTFYIQIDDAIEFVTTYKAYGTDNLIQLFKGERGINFIPQVVVSNGVFENEPSFALDETSELLPEGLTIDNTTGAIRGDLGEGVTVDDGYGSIYKVVTTYVKNPQLKISKVTDVTISVVGLEEGGYGFDDDFDNLEYNTNYLGEYELPGIADLPNDSTVEWYLNKTLPEGMTLVQESGSDTAKIVWEIGTQPCELTEYTLYALITTEDGDSYVISQSFNISGSDATPDNPKNGDLAFVPTSSSNIDDYGIYNFKPHVGIPLEWKPPVLTWDGEDIPGNMQITYTFDNHVNDWNTQTLESWDGGINSNTGIISGTPNSKTADDAYSQVTASIVNNTLYTSNTPATFKFRTDIQDETTFTTMYGEDNYIHLFNDNNDVRSIEPTVTYGSNTLTNYLSFYLAAESLDSLPSGLWIDEDTGAIVGELDGTIEDKTYSIKVKTAYAVDSYLTFFTYTDVTLKIDNALRTIEEANNYLIKNVHRLNPNDELEYKKTQIKKEIQYGQENINTDQDFRIFLNVNLDIQNLANSIVMSYGANLINNETYSSKLKISVSGQSFRAEFSVTSLANNAVVDYQYCDFTLTKGSYVDGVLTPAKLSGEFSDGTYDDDNNLRVWSTESDKDCIMEKAWMLQNPRMANEWVNWIDFAPFVLSSGGNSLVTTFPLSGIIAVSGTGNDTVYTSTLDTENITFFKEPI